MKKYLIFALFLISGCVSAPPKPDVFTQQDAIESSKVLTLDDGKCTGTAVGPRLLVTATHCTEDLVSLMIDGDKVKIDHLISDTTDHTFIVLTENHFKKWAKFGHNKLKITDRVFYVGNPGYLDKIYREGYVAGYMSSRKAWLLDINGFFGDSGSGIFNEQNELVGVLSSLVPQSQGVGYQKFMGVFEFTFTQEQLKELDTLLN